MEQINLKILPISIIAFLASYLSFQEASLFIKQPELVFDLELIFGIIFRFTFYTALTAFLVSLNLSLTKSKTYRSALFGLLALPYLSIFVVQNYVNLLYLGLLIVFFIAMSLAIVVEFDRLYSNQIKAYLQVPSRASARNLTFFIALAASLVFFGLNQGIDNQQILADKITENFKQTTLNTIENYGGVDALIQQQLGVTQPNLNSVQLEFDDYLNNQIDTVLTPYKPYIFYILLILVFGVLAGAASFASVFAGLISVVSIPILKSFGFLNESKEEVEVTRLTL